MGLRVFGERMVAQFCYSPARQLLLARAALDFQLFLVRPFVILSQVGYLLVAEISASPAALVDGQPHPAGWRCLRRQAEFGGSSGLSFCFYHSHAPETWQAMGGLTHIL